MYYEKKIYDILNESDGYKAKSKDTGKVVVFKSKDAMAAAVKGGSHEPVDKPAGGSKDKPKGQSVFAPKPKDEPKPAETGKADDLINKHGKFGDGTSLPAGTNSQTKISDLDREDVEGLFDNVGRELSQKYDITTGVLDDLVSTIIDDSETIGDMVDTMEASAEEASSEGGIEGYDEPGDSSKPEEPFYSTTQGIIYKHGDNLPSDASNKTKIKDLDEDDVDNFFDSAANYFAEKNDITMGAMADMKDDIIRYSDDLGELADSIKGAAEEAAEEGGYEGYHEGMDPKKQPFREHYNRLFKGRSVL